LPAASGTGAYALVIDVDTESTPIRPQIGKTEGNADRTAQMYRYSDDYPVNALRDVARLKDLLESASSLFSITFA